MPLILKERDTDSTERMDETDSSREKLFNTYRYFSSVNAIVSGWGRIYEKKIKPFLKRKKSATLLDIGFGGGDIPIKLARRAAHDGLVLKVTGIETDPRAIEFIQTLGLPANVEFRQSSSTKLLETGAQYDFVLSNHLLHHLNENEIQLILNESKALSRKSVLFNDIERCDVAYGVFGILTAPFFKNSFITEDGLTSIKRSFTYKELKALKPPEWKLQSLFPSRLLLSYEH